MTLRPSLAELAAAGIQLHPDEAVTIVTEICRRCERGSLRGVPPPGVIRLSGDGALVVEGPMTTGDDVAMAANLLGDLLADFDTIPEYRASGALRLAIARAQGTLDLPPYRSLSDFCQALERFGSGDVRDVGRALFQAWDRTRAGRHLQGTAAAALTISDIRRARRATGLSLEEVSAVADVPAVQLRDLEWGYMRSWRADDEGRAQVVRYARAAGLDEGLVLGIAWPMIQDAGSTVAVVETAALVPSGPQMLTMTRPAAARRRPAYRGWIAVAVVALLLTVLTTLAMFGMTSGVTPPAVHPLQVGAAEPAAPVASEPRETPPAASEKAAPAGVERVRALRPAPRRQPPQRRKSDKKPGLLDREWIRFVFK